MFGIPFLIFFCHFPLLGHYFVSWHIWFLFPCKWPSGIFIIWRRRVLVYIPRSLCCCYALSLPWSLVKAFGYVCHPVNILDYYFSLKCISMDIFKSISFKFETLIFVYAPRYVEVNMDSAAIVWPLFNSLQAFWPGLQVSFCLFFYI